MSRRTDVARLAGVPEASVLPASAKELRAFYADSQSATVVSVATQEPSTYWRVGDRYYLDDPYFGPVTAIDDLRYDDEIGLHRKDLGGLP